MIVVKVSQVSPTYCGMALYSYKFTLKEVNGNIGLIGFFSAILEKNPYIDASPSL